MCLKIITNTFSSSKNEALGILGIVGVGSLAYAVYVYRSKVSAERRLADETNENQETQSLRVALISDEVLAKLTVLFDPANVKNGPLLLTATPVNGASVVNERAQLIEKDKVCSRLIPRHITETFPKLPPCTLVKLAIAFNPATTKKAPLLLVAPTPLETASALLYPIVPSKPKVGRTNIIQAFINRHCQQLVRNAVVNDLSRCTSSSITPFCLSREHVPVSRLPPPPRFLQEKPGAGITRILFRQITADLYDDEGYFAGVEESIMYMEMEPMSDGRVSISLLGRAIVELPPEMEDDFAPDSYFEKVLVTKDSVLGARLRYAEWVDFVVNTRYTVGVNGLQEAPAFTAENPWTKGSRVNDFFQDTSTLSDDVAPPPIFATDNPWAKDNRVDDFFSSSSYDDAPSFAVSDSSAFDTSFLFG